MRKGKGEDVTEQDMASVVHAHNCKASTCLLSTLIMQLLQCARLEVCQPVSAS